MGKLKNFTDKLEIWKKVVETIMVTLPLLGLLGTATTFTVKAIYSKEINEFKEAVKFMELAKDSVLPKSYRTHGLLEHRLEKLESKHSKGFAVGLRWDAEREKMYFRHPDGMKYDTFQRPQTVQWQYTKDGVDYYVYN